MGSSSVFTSSGIRDSRRVSSFMSTQELEERSRERSMHTRERDIRTREHGNVLQRKWWNWIRLRSPRICWKRGRLAYTMITSSLVSQMHSHLRLYPSSCGRFLHQAVSPGCSSNHFARVRHGDDPVPDSEGTTAVLKPRFQIDGVAPGRSKKRRTVLIRMTSDKKSV